MRKAKRPTQLPETEPPKLELFSATVTDVNAEKRTCNALWYTGAAVMRQDWMTGEKYMLSLSMKPEHCNLARMNSGAPVLDDHASFGVGNVLGVVESAVLQNGQGVATVRFSDRADVTPIWNDIQSGILRNLSVGSSIRKLQDVTPDGAKLKQYLAVDWEPMEISVVPIPADPGAGFLSNQEVLAALVEETGANDPNKETLMAETTGTQLGQVTAPDENAIRAAERARIASIHKLAQPVGLTEFAAQHVESGSSIEEFRSAAFDELAKRGQATATQSQTTAATISVDGEDKFRAAVENALLNRWDPTKHKLEAGREFRSMSLLRMSEECLSRGGAGNAVRGASPAEMAGAALGMRVERFAGVYDSTGSFPYILANVANKTLRAAYSAYPQTWRGLSRTTTVQDFKTKYVNQLSEAPTPMKVAANGEYKHVHLSEARESYAIATYGEIIAINRQVLINDDLGAFTRIPMLQGRAFNQLESDVVWALITANPTMGADSVALFEASTHKNLTSGGTAISVTSLGVGRAALRVMTNLGGVEYLNLVPRYLAVPTAKEGLAYQYTSPLYMATQASAINEFATNGRTPLEVIVEPRLDAASATAWYLFADPGQIDIIEVAYLAGQEGVYTEMRQGFDIDGVEMKARLDFGAQILDWRGCYKNVGA